MALYTYTCQQCGIEFTNKNRGRKYCSRKCHYDAHREMLTCAKCGKQFQSPKHYRKNSATHYCSPLCAIGNDGNGPTIFTFTCEQCGVQYSRKLGRMQRHNGHRFCSRACTNEWNKINAVTGKKHPRFASVQVPCATCGKMLTRQPYRLREWEEQYCNRQCAGKARPRRFSEANHPKWMGGKQLGYRGPNWEKQAAATRKRDGYRCQKCGISQKKVGRKLDVHHIIPFRSFGYVPGENNNYLEANQLSNLISLCPSCHQLAESGREPIQLPLLISPLL